VAEPIVGIVLAAGLSRRLGRPKQLEVVAGRPLVAHVVATALASSLDYVLVVVGAEADEIRSALTSEPVTVVENPAYATGQASSVVAGVRAARHLRADAVVMLLADQPGVQFSAIDALVAARQAGARLGIARYGDQQGHPVLFGNELFGDLLSLTGDTGGREIVRRWRQDLVVVDGGRPQMPADLDTESDLNQIRLDLSAPR
jgi:molybdenum cofactor cytidylyltransferase